MKDTRTGLRTLVLPKVAIPVLLNAIILSASFDSLAQSPVDLSSGEPSAAQGWMLLNDTRASYLTSHFTGNTRQYLYLNGNRWYMSPPTTLVWSWSLAQQLTGIYTYFDGANTSSIYCAGSGELPHVGVGCSNGPGTTAKVYTTDPIDPTNGQTTVCQDIPDIFRVGACALATIYVRVADVPPPPIVTIATPADGAVYVQGATVNASYSCSDSASGVATCTGTAPSGTPINTANLGPQSFTVNATNNAGNFNSRTVHYSVLPGGGACAPIPNGLIAWWRGEGDTTDATGLFSGHWVGSSQFESGAVGQAFNLTGTNYVDIPWSQRLNPTAAMTVEAWIYPKRVPAYSRERIVSSYGYGGGQDFGFFFGREGAESQSTANLAFLAAGGRFEIGAGELPLNTWYHAVATYDGSRARFYVNGILTSSSEASGPLRPSVLDTQIGHDPTDTGNYWQGAIDEVALYDRALSDDEVASVFLAGTSGKCAVGSPPPPDVTPPTVTISSPRFGNYVVGSTVLADFACADTQSGVARCTGDVSTGTAIDTSTTGQKNFTVMTTDNAGNGHIESVSYSVTRMATSPGSLNTTTAVGASSSPLSIQVTNASPQTITIGASMIDGTDAPAFRGTTNSCYMETLQPGQSCTIALAFTPYRAGSHTAVLHIGELPLGDSPAIVPLSANATGSTPSYAPSTYSLTDLTPYLPESGPKSCSQYPNNDINPVLCVLYGSDITSFNNHGVAAGYALWSNDADQWWLRSFTIDSGVSTQIPAPDPADTFCCGDSGQPQGPAVQNPLINDSGDVVGVQWDPVAGNRPFLFSAFGATSTFLQGQISGGSTFVANSNVRPAYFGNDGSVYLLTDTPSGRLRQLFSAGSLATLHAPDAVEQLSAADIYDVSSHHVVTTQPFSCNCPALGGEGAGAPIIPAAASTSGLYGAGVFVRVSGLTPGALNSSGSVLGSDVLGGNVLWNRSLGAVNLSTLLPPGWRLGPPVAINDPGQILLWAYDPSSNYRLVRLSPIVSTPVGSNVQVQSGLTSLQFTTVATTGATTVSQIDPSSAGQTPGGFAISDTIAYQVSTTAAFSGPVTIGFVVPGPISQTDFNNLRILHNDNGNLVDITSGYDYIRLTIYGTTNSFSPFYIARRGPHITSLFDQTKAYKGGSTIPVKLQVMNAANANISAATMNVTAFKLLRLQNSTTTAVIDSGNANPDYNFRFDPTIGSTGGYIFNLSTKGLQGGKYSLSFYVGNDKQYIYNVAFEVR